MWPKNIRIRIRNTGFWKDLREEKKAILVESLLQAFFSLCRRSANAVLVRELQAKVDKGENIEFELQVKKPLAVNEY